jgi:hypothetical protein
MAQLVCYHTWTAVVNGLAPYLVKAPSFTSCRPGPGRAAVDSEKFFLLNQRRRQFSEDGLMAFESFGYSKAPNDGVACNLCIIMLLPVHEVELQAGSFNADN